jgi:hypothetical protein
MRRNGMKRLIGRRRSRMLDAYHLIGLMGWEVGLLLARDKFDKTRLDSLSILRCRRDWTSRSLTGSQVESRDICHQLSCPIPEPA